MLGICDSHRLIQRITSQFTQCKTDKLSTFLGIVYCVNWINFRCARFLAFIKELYFNPLAFRIIHGPKRCCCRNADA